MLTPEQIDALTDGSVIYDRDGDKLTRVDGFWTYIPGFQGTSRPQGWPPYSLVPPKDARR